MKIKKLEVVGFKSFVDRTVVHFDHDVTGIVGPNGCGKSNVVDAIKWVMGEQSPGRLRGKNMDDVIFNGSEARGPHGFAEVSITFDNTDGLTPVEYRDYAEITVTRYLDRQGKSEYRINKVPVRLMDVTNLFLGTGVGRRAYSIIEQGRIGFIVSSKAEDRRSMIEEAAGITKFKVRKRAAERKMDQTRQNLTRIGDILGELEKNLASLKRQAQKAERYKRYREEARDLELWAASFRYLELFTESRVVRSQLDHASAAEEGVRLALRVREAELEGERSELQRFGREVEHAQTETYELDNEVRVLEGQIDAQLARLAVLREQERRAERDLGELRGQRDVLGREQAALQSALAELESVEAEASSELAKENEELERRRVAVADAERAMAMARGRLGDAKTRIARAETVLAGVSRRRTEQLAQIESRRGEREASLARADALEEERRTLAARLEGLRGGQAATAQEKEDLERELQELRAEIRESDTRVDQLRTQTAERRSRLRSLSELQQRFEGVGAGVRAIMTRYAPTATERSEKKVCGLVADRVEMQPEHTRALAAALGEHLEQVVVQDEEAALAALAWLDQEGAARATLIPQRAACVERPALDFAAWRERAEVVGPAVDLVRVADEDRALIERLLGTVLVVRDFESARAIRREGAPFDLVTLQGERLGREGTMTGGAADDHAAHVLEMKREARELEGLVQTLDAELATAVARHGELRTGIANRQASLDAARTATHDHEIQIVKTEKDLRRASDDAERARVRATELEAEIASSQGAVSEIDEEERAARQESEAAQNSADEAQSEHGAAEAVYQERRRSVEEQSTRVTEVRVRAAQARERVESDQGALQRLERSLEELDTRSQRLETEVVTGAQEQGKLFAGLMGSREELGEQVEKATRAHEVLGDRRARFDEAQEALGDAESGLRALRAQIDSVGSEVTGLTVRERELAMELEHLLDHVDERHRVDLRTVLIEYHHRELPDAQVSERTKELQRLIDRMGEINLTAIEEYEEKSVRFETLDGQRQDLEDALGTLDKAIRQMNRESRRMFKEAFVAVNERFKRLFPEMFRGGKAELRLTDPNDLLGSGVDIIAQPPGKKLGSLELMSGGEKALTAVALIFAIFQYKPSPFCLLDEVDAPLDEANISRFAQAIRQMTERSQFIVITHSKRTMEYTDVLYGVTMEQPGISKLVAVELRGEKRPVPGIDERRGAVA